MGKKRFKMRRKNTLAVRFIIIVSLFGAVCISVDCRIRPTIKSIAQSRAVVMATKLTDEAVMSVLSENEFEYDYLVNTSEDEQGNITSLQANSLHINQLSALISSKVSDSISKIEHTPIKIPIGTLIGGDFFSGRGPEITFYISLTGNVRSEIVSSFYDAGINQTLHSISLDMTSTIFVVCSGYNTSTKTSSNITVAQSVIVGKVPETYNKISANLDEYTGNYPLMD